MGVQSITDAGVEGLLICRNGEVIHLTKKENIFIVISGTIDARGMNSGTETMLLEDSINVTRPLPRSFGMTLKILQDGNDKTDQWQTGQKGARKVR